MIKPKNCPFCGAAGSRSYCIDELNNTFVCRNCREHYYSDGKYAEDTFDVNLKSDGCPGCGSHDMKDYHWQGVHKCNNCGWVFRWGKVDYGVPVKYLYCPTCQKKKIVRWTVPNATEWVCDDCGGHYYVPGYSPRPQQGYTWQQPEQPKRRSWFSGLWNGYSDPDDLPSDGFDIGDGY